MKKGLSNRKRAHRSKHYHVLGMPQNWTLREKLSKPQGRSGKRAGYTLTADVVPTKRMKRQTANPPIEQPSILTKVNHDGWQRPRKTSKNRREEQRGTGETPDTYNQYAMLNIIQEREERTEQPWSQGCCVHPTSEKRRSNKQKGDRKPPAVMSSTAMTTCNGMTSHYQGGRSPEVAPAGGMIDWNRTKGYHQRRRTPAVTSSSMMTHWKQRQKG